MVCASMGRHPTRRDAARQGTGLGCAGGCRRVRSQGRHGARPGQPRHDIRRQPAGHAGRRRDLAHHGRARSAGERRQGGCGLEGRAGQGTRRRGRRGRDSRPGVDARHRTGSPVRRTARPCGPGRPAAERHRRSRDPSRAAVDRHVRRGAADRRHPVPADQEFSGGNASQERMKPGMSLIKHYLQFKDLRAEEYAYLFERAAVIKRRFKNYEKYQPLVDRTLAMIFEKASTRTRVSFEAGMYQMGGSVVNLTTGDSQLGRAEPIEDTARVISRMVDIVMIRTFEQSKIERFAAHSRVPVINGLTNEYHPCQILADIYTYIEHRGSIAGRTVAWIGDSNNVCRTWLQAATIFGFSVHVSTPPGYEIRRAEDA